MAAATPEEIAEGLEPTLSDAQREYLRAGDYTIKPPRGMARLVWHGGGTRYPTVLGRAVADVLAKRGAR